MEKCYISCKEMRYGEYFCRENLRSAINGTKHKEGCGEGV